MQVLRNASCLGCAFSRLQAVEKKKALPAPHSNPPTTYQKSTRDFERFKKYKKHVTISEF